MGVSRIARLTLLDRTGVEVAAAIRPDGHVLQVSNGKGETFEHAALSALMEAAELTAAEQVPSEDLIYASTDAMVRRFGTDQVLGPHLWDGGELLAVPDLWTSDVVLAWQPGSDCTTGDVVFVPACLVYCPPVDQPWLGPNPFRWTTNGLAAHRTQEGALQHALLELVERDALAVAYPQGLTAGAIRNTLVGSETLERMAPALSAWRRRIEERGFEVYVLDLSTASRCPQLAVAAAVLVDLEEGPIPVTAGYACRARFDDAALAALFEAAQSRLTDIQAVREDVTAMRAKDVKDLRAALRASTRARKVARTVRRPPRQRLPVLLAHLARAGVPRVVAVSHRVEGAKVVRLLAPGLALSGLL